MDDARYFAYLALLSKKTIENALTYFQKKFSIAQKDFNLAYEISSGVVRYSLTLDHYILQLQKKIKLKKEGRALLRMAIYQYCFMDKIPYYAICNQTIEIAKHQRLKNIPFLNALVRKIEKTEFLLPKDKSIKSLSIRYSYPEYFVKELVDDIGLKKAEKLLEIQNKIYPSFARIRDKKISKTFIELDKKKIQQIKDDPNYYIQNPTFYKLVDKLKLETKAPKNILDLCAAPGGKLLLASDLYPSAKLFANDVNTTRLKPLKQNIEKYNLDVHLTNEDASKLESKEKYDLIILDVPCSNSGVLAKRVEARWKLSKENVADLSKLQDSILQNAKKLLSDSGVIWYLTCSILSSENQTVIEKALKKGLSLKGKMHTIYPDSTGLDGGFGCVLAK